MKRLLLCCAALALAVPAAQVIASTAQDPRPDRPQRPEGGGGPERQASALKGHMAALQEGVEKLTAALDADDAEPKYDELLDAVCQLQRVSIDAKSETPRSLSRLEEKDKAKALASYRTQMHALTNALFEVEVELLAEDVKQAKKALRALEQVQSKGHGEFKKGGRGR